MQLSNAPHQDVAKKVFRDQETLNAFLQAQDVTAQRLYLERKPGGVHRGMLSNYRRGAVVKVSPQLAAQIRQLLKQASSYVWGRGVKMCIVDYGVLFTFEGSGSPIRVAICFECDWLGIFTNDDDTRIINEERDIDPARRELVAIVKSIFPDDPEIQELM